MEHNTKNYTMQYPLTCAIVNSTEAQPNIDNSDIGDVGKEEADMKATLLGVQRVSFKSNEGTTISGNSFFIAFPDENVEGLKTDRIFVREGVEIPKDIKLNDSIDLSFNMKGRVEKIVKA